MLGVTSCECAYGIMRNTAISPLLQLQQSGLHHRQQGQCLSPSLEKAAHSASMHMKQHLSRSTAGAESAGVQETLSQGRFELAADLLRFVQPLGEPDASIPVAAAPQPHALGSGGPEQVCAHLFSTCSSPAGWVTFWLGLWTVHQLTRRLGAGGTACSSAAAAEAHAAATYSVLHAAPQTAAYHFHALLSMVCMQARGWFAGWFQRRSPSEQASGAKPLITPACGRLPMSTFTRPAALSLLGRPAQHLLCNMQPTRRPICSRQHACAYLPVLRRTPSSSTG